jgi:hypothetical protein
VAECRVAVVWLRMPVRYQMSRCIDVSTKEIAMPAPTAWRPLDAYPAFMRPLVQYMWEQRPPLNPSQFAARAGVRRQLLSAYLNSPADARLAPEPDVVRRFARAMDRPTSELMTLAGHGDAEDPFLDRVEAVDFALAELGHLDLDASSGTPDELETCRRVLTMLRAREVRAVRAVRAVREHTERHNAHAESLATVAAAAPSDEQVENTDG